MLKEIGIFLAGSIVGAGAAYFVTKSVCEKNCQKDINDIKEMYENKIEADDDEENKDISVTKNEDIEEEEEEEKKPEVKDISEDIEEDHIITGRTSRGLDKSKVNTTRTNYSKVTRAGRTRKTTTEQEDDNEMDIFEISVGKYNRLANESADGLNDYETMSVLYSRNEQKVFAENGMPVDRELIGDDILTNMEDNCEEGDYIYCENATKKIAFEICFSE